MCFQDGDGNELIMKTGMTGIPSSQMMGFVMGKLYEQFIENDITNFDEFHVAILDIFNTINAALPGKHYDVPSRKKVEDCFEKWKETKEDKRKEVIMEFVKENVNLGKLDDSMMITGIVAPPAAMAVKRAGENVSQLKIIKVIPDVVFVPSATILALVSVKFYRRIFMGK